MLVFFALAYLRLPPEIPLFYSLPNSTDQVVSTWFIVIIPLISLMCIVANSFMSNKLKENYALVEDVTQIANIVIMVMSAYIFIKIIVLVAF
jgi:hypothetical protein